MVRHSLAITLIVILVSGMAAGCGSSGSTPALTSTPTPVPQPVSEEISWQIGETTVYATVTYPDDEGVYPAVVFVPGSGPTDRDWNSPLLPGTNGSGLLLAEELARHGFVTLRYDKRFAGPGATSNLPHLVGNISLQGHVEEIAGSVEELLSRSYVNPGKIYVLANSEGTIHALNYHLEHGQRFSGLVLTSPPGRTMGDLVIEQVRAQVQGLPDGDEMMAGFETLVHNFLEGKPFTANPALPGPLNDLASSWYQPVNLPFTHEIFPLDPTELLRQVTVPALVVIGKKDVQVDWQVDGALLQAATTGLAGITFAYPENANHVMKYEPKPREELSALDGLEYNSAGRVLDEGAVRVIIDWLDQQSQAD